MPAHFIYPLLSVLVLACGGQNSQTRETPDSTQIAAPEKAYFTADNAGSGQSSPPTGQTMIIRDGRMQMQVADIHKAKQAVDAIIGKYAARSSGEQYENNDYQATYNVRIRVPADQLDALIADIEGIDGSLISKTLDAREVTEEFIDLELRIGNKRSYLEQYRALLKTARTTEDIVKVTEQIRVIEEELESAEGRLRYLKDQVAMSTLELHLTQQKEFIYRADRRLDFVERLKESLSDGWYGFIGFLFVLFRLWPFLLLSVLLWILIRKRKQRHKTRAKEDK